MKKSIQLAVGVLGLSLALGALAARNMPASSQVPVQSGDGAYGVANYIKVDVSKSSGPYKSSADTLAETLAGSNLTQAEMLVVKLFLNNLLKKIDAAGQYAGVSASGAADTVGAFSSRGGSCTIVTGNAAKVIDAFIKENGSPNFTRSGRSLTWWTPGPVELVKGNKQQTADYVNHVAPAVDFKGKNGTVTFVIDTTARQFPNTLDSDFVAVLPPLLWAEMIGASVSEKKNPSRTVWMVERALDASAMIGFAPPAASMPEPVLLKREKRTPCTIS